jgi:hypothetical protein
MGRRYPVAPAHPERVCWGCDRLCAADRLVCGNGSVRTPHLVELFGDDWMQWGQGQGDAATAGAAADAGTHHDRSPPASGYQR